METRGQFGRDGDDRSGRDGDCENRSPHTGRSPFTVTRVPERVCGQ